MALAPVFNAIGNQAIKAARMYTVRYGPTVSRAAADATAAFEAGAEASRQFKIDAAIEQIEPLTKGERHALSAGTYDDMTILENYQCDHIPDRTIANKSRTIKLYSQSISACRNIGVDTPIPMFSHWGIEVDGTFFELRRPRIEDISHRQTKKVLYAELGETARNIKFEVTTDRAIHSSTQYDTIGTTTLDDRAIIWAASTIFRRFGTGYDLLIDNCQHFARLLTEVIISEEDRISANQMFGDKAVIKIPAMASWVIAPVYGGLRAVHYALGPDTEETERSKAFTSVDKALDKIENWYLHPHIYATRKAQKLFQL